MIAWVGMVRRGWGGGRLGLGTAWVEGIPEDPADVGWFDSEDPSLWPSPCSL